MVRTPRSRSRRPRSPAGRALPERLLYAKEEAPLSPATGLEAEAAAARVNVLSGGSYLLDDLARGAQGAIPGRSASADLARAFDSGRPATTTAPRPFDTSRRCRLPAPVPLLCAKEVARRSASSAATCASRAAQRLDEQDHRELTP